MALQNCHECGKEVSTNADKCPNCGAPVKKPFLQKKIGCLGAIVIVILFAAIASLFDSKTPQTSTPPQSPPQKTQTDDSFIKMTAKEHLEAAQKSLSDGYKPNKDPMKTTWGHVTDARKHLEAIKQNDSEYSDAKKLMTEVVRREKEIEKASAIIAKKFMIEQRETLAKRMEREYLSKGMDVDVILSGSEKTTIKLQYVLFNRPFVYKLTNETDVLENLKKAGFKKVILSDGYRYSWTFDLKK